MQGRRCPQCAAEYDDPSLSLCPADGTPLPSLDTDPLIGRVVAERYEVKSRLGHGGMGAVYVARQIAMDREVALKVLKPELAAHKSMRSRFEREARSASRISSVRVVTMIDYGCTDDGLYYIAMELLDGMNLGELIAIDGRLAPFEAIRVATEIARALDAAHESGVVHRDLKPENVFLTAKEAAIKVLDFGIAKMLGESPPAGDQRRQTGGNAIIGTPAYISPEAARGESVGPPADLYALGVILFEMLAGRRPFKETAPILLFDMHAKVPPPRLSEVAPELPVLSEVEELVDRLLDKDPRRRPNAVRTVARLEAIAGQLAMLGEGEPSSLVSGSFLAEAPTYNGPAPVAPVAPSRLPLVLGIAGALLALGVIVASAVVVVALLAEDPEPMVVRERAPEAVAAPVPSVATEAVATVTSELSDAGPAAQPAPVELRPRFDPLRRRVQIE